MTESQQTAPRPVKRKKVAMQPVVLVGEVARFQKNRLVDAIYEKSTFQMNEANAAVQKGEASRAEYEQLAQLLGYSVSGFGDISLARRKVKEEAQKKVQRLVMKRAKAASRRLWEITGEAVSGEFFAISMQNFELRSVVVSGSDDDVTAMAVDGVPVILKRVGNRHKPVEKTIVCVGQRMVVMTMADAKVKLKGKVVAS